MTKATSPELPLRGRLRLRIAIALCTVFGCAEAPPPHEDADPLASPDALSSTAQALSADPGPKNLFVGGVSEDRFQGQTRSDGTYVYVHYYRDAGRSCWGQVLRRPVGGGAVTSAMAPCGTRGFAVLNDSVYFAVVQLNDYSEQHGIYHRTFSVDGGAYLPMLTTIDALAIATDGHYLYWNDSAAALHRMLPDGTGDVILAANAAVAGEQPLIVDDSSVYGYDGAELWRVPKGGGEKTTLATVGASVSALQLDSGELFWIDSRARIQRLPVTGGTPSTFHETVTNGEPWPYTSGFFGLAVAQGWVYWAVYSSNLERRAKTGGAVETIVTAERGAVVHGADATNVYYVRQTMFAPPRPELRRLPIADLVAPFCGHTPRGLANAATPLGLAAADSWVYYTEGDNLRRVWKNGGSVETVSIGQPGARALHANADGLDGVAWVTDEGVTAYHFGYLGAGLVAAAADAKDVFLGAKDPTVRVRAKLYYIDGTRLVGPADTTLAIGLAPYRLAGDESWLYWTDRGDQTVNRVPRAGGSVEVLARVTSGEIGDLELDLDTDELIFGVDDGDSGRILRVPKAGGAAALVAEGAFSPFALEAAGPSVYFTSQGPGAGTVYRVAKRGGTPAVLEEGGAAFELDTLGSCVFYATDTGIDVVSCHGTTAADDLNAEPCGLCNAGACDDHDPCTSADACSGGTCVGTEIDCTALDDVCVVGTCDRADGTCEAVDVSNGAACSDGDVCSDGDECHAGSCVSGDDICAGGAAPDAAVTPADAGGTSSVDGDGDAEGAADAGGGAAATADAGGDAAGAADAGGDADQDTGGAGGGAEGTADGDGARDGGLAGGDGDGNDRWGCGVLGMRPSRGPAGLGSALLLLLLARLRRRGL